MHPEESSHRVTDNHRSLIESTFVLIQKCKLFLEVRGIIPRKLHHDDFISDLFEFSFRRRHPSPICPFLNIIPTMEQECSWLLYPVGILSILFCQCICDIVGFHEIVTICLLSKHNFYNYILIKKISMILLIKMYPIHEREDCSEKS